MADINDLKDICISSGTLRAEDLLPRFMGILKDYAPEKFNEFIKGYPELDGWEDFLEADWRIISDDTKMNASDELFGLLNDIAPEGTMFSSTEGDGADFGFWTVEEKLLDDDEGEKALKQMAKDGKSTGEVAADIRYDVATALDMAADKAEDLMTKFGLDKIYVLRAKGQTPEEIATEILKATESKDERRDSANYLQEVWDALVSVWDKDKFDMAKGYDDEYECEAITITVKDNEGVRAKIYVDDHEGKHPVGFDVIYRYPGDKGVGDLGYYEFQSTDFDETAPEIFAYFDELKGKVGEAKGDNWVAYYFCEDPQGLEWAVLPHAINGIGNASCVNSRGGNDSIAIEYVLDECTPIEDVKGSDIYGKVKDFEDRDIVALTRDEAERIVLADDRLKELKAIVSLKDESKNEDLNTAKDFVYSIAPIGILIRQASQPGFKDAKNSSDHIIVGFMHHDNTRFIIDWDADKKQGTATRQVMVDDKDTQYGYNWVTPKSNANVTFTTREELKDFVEGSWDNTFSESKNESLTLKQKELKDMARYGEAEDITTISDAEAKELKKKGIETVGVSRGTYGMNGALLRDRDGNKYVITARSSNLFYFV